MVKWKRIVVAVGAHRQLQQAHSYIGGAALGRSARCMDYCMRLLLW